MAVSAPPILGRMCDGIAWGCGRNGAICGASSREARRTGAFTLVVLIKFTVLAADLPRLRSRPAIRIASSRPHSLATMLAGLSPPAKFEGGTFCGYSLRAKVEVPTEFALPD